MTNLFAILGGLVGAVVGWIAAAAIAIVVSGYFGVSDFEGQRGMAAIFFFGPIGGIVGLVVGTWFALRLRSGAKVGSKGLALRLLVVIIAIAGLAIAAFTLLYRFNPILNPNGLAPRLAFEIKLPAGSAVPAKGIEVNLNTERNTMPATLIAGAAPDESGRPVLSGSVELYYRSSWRIVELKIANTPEHLFVLRTGARPGHDDDFGNWEHVSNVGNGTDHPRLATPEDAYDIRYRVIWPD
jgi:MFS family permease